MSEKKALTPEQKAALGVFKERRGVSEELRQYYANFKKTRKKIVVALGDEPATIPQLAERTGLAADLVLWHLMGMRKYGELKETGDDGDYALYQRIKE